MDGPRYPRKQAGDAYWNVASLKLYVVPMSGYDRTRCFDEQPGIGDWIPPSPNIPSVGSALCYVGSGLYDGNTIGEMVHGYEQFIYIGMPFVRDRDDLEGFIASARTSYHFPGVELLPAVDPRTGRFTVIKLEVTDRARFNSSYTAVALLYTQARRYPAAEFFTSDAGRRSFSIVHGSDWLVTLFDAPADLPPFDTIVRRLDAEAAAFKEIRKNYLLY